MDFSGFFRRSWVFNRISKRVHALSQPFNQRVRVSLYFARKLKGVYLLVGAAVFGSFGYQAAKKEAQMAWESSRFPPELTRDFVFQAYGLTRVKDQVLLQKVHRLIPMSTSDEGVFWLSAEGGWVVLYRDHEDEDVIQVYCKICKPIPQKWEPSPRGWLGFDQVLERLELLKKSKGLEELKPPRLGRARVDPRELIY